MRDLGGRAPNWGYTESVLVDGDQVVCTPGGSRGAVAALDKKTGKLLWQSKDFTDPAQYSSLVAAEHNGRRQYIQLTQQSLVGVSAKDGAVFWRTGWTGRTAVIPTPIFKDGNEVSRFGQQIQRFACLYTGKVSNFISYPPNKYFQSPIDLMPHDV